MITLLIKMASHGSFNDLMFCLHFPQCWLQWWKCHADHRASHKNNSRMYVEKSWAVLSDCFCKINVNEVIFMNFVRKLKFFLPIYRVFYSTQLKIILTSWSVKEVFQKITMQIQLQPTLQDYWKIRFNFWQKFSKVSYK